MPNKKQISPKPSRNLSKLNEEAVTTEEIKNPAGKGRMMLIGGLILAIIALSGYVFKDKFIAAIINGKPIFRYQLNKRLVSVYGKETLENLIIENLINEQVAKNKVAVAEKEINAEVEKISATLGAGTKIEDVLKLQGVTLKDFRDQIKMRLEVSKILEKGLTITDEEIAKYVKDNAKSLTASGEAELKAEAKDKLKEQKISEQIQTWVADLIKNAKITRFLK